MIIIVSSPDGGQVVSSGTVGVYSVVVSALVSGDCVLELSTVVSGVLGVVSLSDVTTALSTGLVVSGVIGVVSLSDVTTALSTGLVVSGVLGVVSLSDVTTALSTGLVVSGVLGVVSLSVVTTALSTGLVVSGVLGAEVVGLAVVVIMVVVSYPSGRSSISIGSVRTSPHTVHVCSFSPISVKVGTFVTISGP